MPPISEHVLRASNVAKTYDEGGLRTNVLSDVSFTLKRGETMAIVGASGSGKSTLLHIIGGLDTLTAGEVEVEGRVLSRLSDAERGAYATARSASSTSSTICCRSSPRWRTCACRC